MSGPGAQPDPLTAEAIVAAAVAISSRESLDALSMRRVARELGRAPMSLYRHVADVDELRARVVEALFASVDIVDHGPEWRRTVEEAAHRLRALLSAHPGILVEVMRTGIRSPAMLQGLDVVVGALRRAGLSPEDAARAHASILGTVFGHAVLLRAAHDAFPEAEDDGAALRGFVAGVLQAGAGAYPNIAAVVPAWTTMGPDEGFTFALTRLLDGIAATASG